MEMEPGKLFIGGISWDTHEEHLKEYFETFGHVTEAVIMKDRVTGRARGFGFVIFSDPIVAERVVKDKHVINGKTVEAKKAVPRDDHQVFNRSNVSSHGGSPRPIRTKKIFVGGLAASVTESDFRCYFDQFGLLTDVVVMYDHNTQRPRGFGFITYDSEESVDKVLLRTFHELNGKMVEVKRAVPKESSPGPSRSNVSGYNYGLSRVSSNINGYAQGYSPSSRGSYGIRVDDRFSPLTVGRTGYSHIGPSSYILGTNYENRNISSNIVYERAVNPMYSVTPNRFPSPIGYNGNSDGRNALLNLANNMWGNGNALNSSNYGLGNFGASWANSNSSEGDNVNGGIGSIFIGGGNGANAIGHRRNKDNSVAPASSHSVIDDGDISGSSFHMNSTWRSSSPDLEVPGLFNFGFGSGLSDGIREKSLGYVGYSDANRSNRGIAAQEDCEVNTKLDDCELRCISVFRRCLELYYVIIPTTSREDR
ncbi:heterogeneous nuclear ribonucleoprotein 1-like protein [Tanacetum coccineum]